MENGYNTLTNTVDLSKAVLCKYCTNSFTLPTIVDKLDNRNHMKDHSHLDYHPSKY